MFVRIIKVLFVCSFLSIVASGLGARHLSQVSREALQSRQSAGQPYGREPGGCNSWLPLVLEVLEMFFKFEIAKSVLEIFLNFKKYHI